MDERIIEIAASTMKVPIDEAIKHYKEISEISAYYFWNPVRGGISVIVNMQGEKLGATSSVNYQRHLQAFIDGQRN